MKLHELWVRDAGACPNRHRQPVARHLLGIGGRGVQTADPTGRKNDGIAEKRLSVAVRRDHQHADHTIALAQEVDCPGVFTDLDVGAPPHRNAQRAHQLGPRCVAVCVDDAMLAVARLTPECQ